MYYHSQRVLTLTTDNKTTTETVTTIIIVTKIIVGGAEVKMIEEEWILFRRDKRKFRPNIIRIQTKIQNNLDSTTDRSSMT